MARVSVIMNCHNCASFLREAIDSVYAQTFTDWEIVFWDNRSTDDSVQIAQSYDQRLRYFRGTEFVPLGAARNFAIEQCRGEFVSFLDCDDIWLPEKLEKQVKILDADPDIALVYSDSYQMDSSGKPLGKMFDSIEPHRGRVFPEFFLNNFISCLTVVVRKQVLDRAGLFRPNLCIAEEYELFLRIAELYRVDFVDAPLAKYRVHETSFSRNVALGCQEEITVTEECLERSPDLKHALGNKARRKLANLHCNLGLICLANAKKREARKQFSRSIIKYPYQAKPYLFYGLTFLPSEWARRIMSWLRTIKRSVSRLKEQV